MARFTIWIVQTLVDHHSRGFIEVAGGIAHALRQLGHHVAFDPGRAGKIENPLPGPDGKFGRLIVFGANRLPAIPLPEDAIVFNAEQVQTEGDQGDAWQASSYVSLLRRHVVWDYSDANIERLRAYGCERLVKCRVGYWPGLATVQPVEREDIDVLFVGSMNDRRVKVLQDCQRRGLRVQNLFGVYGEERDRFIARAKIVLNVHFYPQPVWEIFRVSHLLANKKCVVTESGGADAELERLAADTCAYVEYDQLATACQVLVRDDTRRRNLAERGHERFKQIDQEAEVGRAFAAS